MPSHDQNDVLTPLYLLDFGEIGLTELERAWLVKTCPYFTTEYIDYLSKYRFKPAQVRVTFQPKDPSAPISQYQPLGGKATGELGKIEIEATGPWHETMLWEVPLMASLSELFFTTVDKDWSYDGQEGVLSAPLSPSMLSNSIRRKCIFQSANLSCPRMRLQ